MLKQRNRPRKNTPHPVKVMDVKSGRILGRVVDITSDGMMIVGKKAQNTGMILDLRIFLPRMVDGKMDITLQGEIVWSAKDDNPKFFKSGVRFLNLPGNDGFLLEDVLHHMNLV